jgi:hypothetical protein
MNDSTIRTSRQSSRLKAIKKFRIPKKGLKARIVPAAWRGFGLRSGTTPIGTCGQLQPKRLPCDSTLLLLRYPPGTVGYLK